jgi:hypothetical protein
MKIILTERQYSIVKEQQSKVPSLSQVPQITSDYLGKGGGFERANKIGGGNLEKQIQSLKKIPPSKIKKVALVFPNKVWYEEFGTAIMNALGVISGWFRSLPEAIGYVNQLEKEGVKTDQLIIGSHGAGQELLITQQEGQFKFNNRFLSDIKNIIHSNTTVFFTACQGADHLFMLKNAAEILGVGAYGAQGVYNFITQSADKGFYWCSAKPIDVNLTQKNQEKLSPLSWNKNGNGGLEIRIPFPGLPKLKKGYGNVTGTLSFQGNKVFGLSVPPINFTSKLGGFGMSDDLLKSGALEYLKYTIKPKDLLQNYVDQIAKQQRKNIWEPTAEKMGKQGIKIFESKVYEDMLKNNTMSISLNLPEGQTNVKSLKEFGLYKSPTNDFLLESGYCKKVNQAPVNWVKEFFAKITGFVNPVETITKAFK